MFRDPCYCPSPPKSTPTPTLLHPAPPLPPQSDQGRRIGMILDLSNHDTLYLDDMPEVGMTFKWEGPLCVFPG